MKEWRHKKIYNKLTKMIDKRAKVLELGPGDGAMLHNLHNSGFNDLKYADIIDRINYPEIKNLGVGLNVDLNHESIPLPDGSQDVILALQILEHLENPWHFERECRRLLKSGGLLFLSMPHGHNFASKIRFFLKGNVMRYECNNEHISFFTVNVFRKLFLKDFVLEGTDYSEPALNKFGIGKNSLINEFLPKKYFFRKYFGNNVYYFLKKK